MQKVTADYGPVSKVRCNRQYIQFRAEIEFTTTSIRKGDEEMQEYEKGVEQEKAVEYMYEKAVCQQK